MYSWSFAELGNVSLNYFKACQWDFKYNQIIGNITIIHSSTSRQTFCSVWVVTSSVLWGWQQVLGVTGEAGLVHRAAVGPQGDRLGVAGLTAKQSFLIDILVLIVRNALMRHHLHCTGFCWIYHIIPKDATDCLLKYTVFICTVYLKWI